VVLQDLGLNVRLRPERVEKLALRHQAAGALHKVLEYAKGLGRQGYPLVVARVMATPQTLVGGIEPEVQEFHAHHGLHASICPDRTHRCLLSKDDAMSDRMSFRAHFSPITARCPGTR